MAADVCAELVTAFSDRIAADTGEGGLANTASAAYVRSVFRYAAPEIRTYNWPALVLMPRAEHFDTLKGATSGRGGARCGMDVVVIADRDAGHAAVNAVIGRFRVRFHRQAVANGSNWEFAPVRIEGVDHPEPTGKELRAVISCGVRAARLSGGL